MIDVNSMRITLSGPQETLLKKWSPVLEVDLDGTPITDIMIKLDISVMCELIENKHSFYAKELIPGICRSFRTMSSLRRGQTIKKYMENNYGNDRSECFDNTNGY